jgi:hypothetical protein
MSDINRSGTVFNHLLYSLAFPPHGGMSLFTSLWLVAQLSLQAGGLPIPVTSETLATGS